MLVLRESFDYPFAEIAEILDTSEANCRQILSRARRRIADERPRFDPDPRERRRLADRFLAAAREGDMDGLVALLAPDAVLVGDGGGKARAIAHADARRGAHRPRDDRLLRALAGMGRQLRARRGQRRARLPRPRPDGRLVNVTSLDIEGGVVTRLHSMSTPTSSATSGRSRTSRCGRCGKPHRDEASHPQCGAASQSRYCSHAQHALHQLPPRDGSLPARRRGSRAPRPAAALAW